MYAITVEYYREYQSNLLCKEKRVRTRGVVVMRRNVSLDDEWAWNFAKNKEILVQLHQLAHVCRTHVRAKVIFEVLE